MRWNKRIGRVFPILLVLLTTIAMGGAAEARGPVHRVPSGGFQVLTVPSSMGPITVQVQWAARGGNAALYLLDGLRARDDQNGWALNTNARQMFAGDNITLVMPVGGAGSFYSDWLAPSNFNGQTITYRWETFLTRELPDFLAGFGVSPNNNAVVGPSMGGTAAMNLAAHHRDQFRYAGSFSGYLDTSSPGMREAIRLAMLSAGGYNADSMYGPPWSGAWARNDPWISAPLLRGLPMYVSAGSGIPGPNDNAGGFIDTLNAIPLEWLADVGTRAFQTRLFLYGIPATWNFPLTGVHDWLHWQIDLAAARPQILDVMNAH